MPDGKVVCGWGGMAGRPVGCVRVDGIAKNFAAGSLWQRPVGAGMARLRKPEA